MSRPAPARFALQLLAGASLASAAHPEDLTTLSLEDLLAVEVDTAAVEQTPWLKQPATLTVFTREELRSLGARTLLEALEHVPGTGFGIDVFGTVSMVFRGQWAHEGKVLLLLDDMPLNDLMYGSLSLARRYPIEQIDRLEVLRGAGAAKYGGNAQLAVIRVYSRTDATPGGTLHLDTEQMEGAGTGWGATFSQGGRSGDLDWYLSVHDGGLPWSGARWEDTGGSQVDLERYTAIESRNLVAQADWRGAYARIFVDDHDVGSPQGFGYFRDGETVQFAANNLMLGYEMSLGEHWTLEPQLQYRTHEDWYIDRDPEERPRPLDFFIPVERLRYSLDARYRSGAQWSVLGGIEHWDESSRAESPGGVAADAASYFNGERAVGYDASAAYVQGEWTLDRWTLTAGARHSDHSYAGSSTVPRLSTVYDAGDWHLKAHWGQAFREPAVDVINQTDFSQDEVAPEETEQREIEFGWRPADRWFATASVFSMRTDDPIIYGSSAGDIFYTNNPAVETRGFETEWRWRSESASLQASYSWYTAHDAEVFQYHVPQEDSLHIGAWQHKLALAGDWRIAASPWSVQASVVHYAEGYAWQHDPTASDYLGNPLAARKLPDVSLVNLGLRYVAPDWSVSAGVQDLADEGRIYPQPYHSESTPYDGESRRAWIALEIKWD